MYWFFPYSLCEFGHYIYVHKIILPLDALTIRYLCLQSKYSVGRCGNLAVIWTVCTTSFLDKSFSADEGGWAAACAEMLISALGSIWGSLSFGSWAISSGSFRVLYKLPPFKLGHVKIWQTLQNHVLTHHHTIIIQECGTIHSS